MFAILAVAIIKPEGIFRGVILFLRVDSGLEVLNRIPAFCQDAIKYMHNVGV